MMINNNTADANIGKGTDYLSTVLELIIVLIGVCDTGGLVFRVVFGLKYCLMWHYPPLTLILKHVCSYNWLEMLEDIKGVIRSGK